MTDTIADMLTRIRNGLAVKKDAVSIPHSKLKEAIASVLKDEGYIKEYQIKETEYGQSDLVVQLKYKGEHSVISHIERVSSPGRRVYVKSKNITPVLSGHGISIISTNQGILSNKQAVKQNIGGELLCQVW